MSAQNERKLSSFTTTRRTARLRIEYLIIQGPLSGLASQRLTAAVSNFGGPGSFGAHGLTPIAIREARVPVFSFMYGIPSKELLAECKKRTSQRSAPRRRLTKCSPQLSLPGWERKVAEALVNAAHQICPYSKAKRGNIDVVINLV